ncbi:MAG: hypothetical protein ACRD29_03080 [Acidimicrobiales bacterium]
MTAVWYRFRAELRTRGRAWLGLGLVVGLAAGAVLALAAGARRTDSVYSRFLKAQNAYDVLVVNYPEDGTAVFDLDELERLPQVADAARADYEYFTFSAANLASEDGRIGTDMNRFKLLEGRRPHPDDPGEIVVGFVLAEKHGIRLGDTVDFLPPELVEHLRSPETTENPFPDELGPDELAGLRSFVDEVPDGELRVVGIEAAPGEFPPQFQLNRPLVHLTPAFARILPESEHEALMVRLHGGSAAVEDFVAELDERSGGLPLQVSSQRDHAAAVERSIHLQALALWLLAGLTAVAALLIVEQLLARLSAIESAERSILAALGMAPHHQFALGVLRTATIGIVGGVVGVGGAVAASPLFPTGLARTAEPAGGFDADLSVLLLGAGLTVVLIVALSVWPVWRLARATGAATAASEVETRPSRFGRLLAGAGIPTAVAVGIRMALEPGRGRSAIPVHSTLGGVALGIAALTAALTFGASLDHLLDTPCLYGVTWDLEVGGSRSERRGNRIAAG